MPDPADSQTPAMDGYSQLTQVRLPMDQAAEAFAGKDSSGRTPIVVVPTRPSHMRYDLFALGALAMVAGVLASGGLDSVWYATAGVPLGLGLIAFGIYRSFFVLVPEGANALLSRRGVYTRTIGTGTHRIPPWVAVSHLVTRREIPFGVPVEDAPTQDNVRAAVDTLLTFTITDPYRFVFSISPSDFDRVLQASCQDTLRSMIRRITWNQVNDLPGRGTEDLRAALDAAITSYGVAITRVNILFGRLPIEFLQSEAARELAILHRAELAEQQALAERRQANDAALARQAILSRAEREREEAVIQLEQGELRRRVEQLDVEAQIRRLAQMEAALKQYPAAAEWEWQGAQLEVARALARNTRAVLQVNNPSEIARSLMVGDFLSATHGPNAENGPVQPSNSASDAVSDGSSSSI